MAWGDDVLKIALANPDVMVMVDSMDDTNPYRIRVTDKRNKFNAQRCEWEGIKFDSKAELARYLELRLLELTGQITNLKLQPVYMLTAGVKYRGDFQYSENGKVICEDVKGFETASWRIKKKLFLELYPDIELRVIK